MHKHRENPNYDYTLYRFYEAFELKARKDKNLIKEIANGDFFEVARKQPEYTKVSHLESKGHGNRAFGRQDVTKR